MPHPNSLANLQTAPAWQPGQSGNPNGRPAAGAVIIEWINELADVVAGDDGDEAKYDDDALTAIRDHPKAPHMKRVAARLILMAHEGGFHDKSGKPCALELWNLIMDRTVGRPTQHVEIDHKPAANPTESRVRMLDHLKRQPALSAMLRDVLDEHDRTIIDTTAVSIGSVDRQ